MAKTKKRRSWFDKPPAQVKVRLPEALRWRLEREATSRGHSMNVEIVRRLQNSLLSQKDAAKLVAEILLDSLDNAITEKMVEIVMQGRADDELAEMAREDKMIELEDEGDGKP